ncbi:tripartite tricarboxylate transporter TctB family protein [Methylorubrum extorquens]|uniref:Small permease of tripartite tricarboxylate transporter n=1 Tax=Methylorubrum extorquens TaxID=408 RepID=A0A1S1PCF6_METEX|nr:small permease of tripartite tricarboxylate transporter [Methylobacterium sp. Leaf90]KQO99315.1 small permease of tripartite tricarboxylate transporter [Methylobacterium sp. Leaf92]OHV18202.1 small permease of tripartite tricarboxylate transporter [Methylorubrum extorquens]
MTEASPPLAERGLSRRAVEIVVALLLLGLAALALWDSYARGAGWDNGPENGFFPARVAAILAIAAIAALVSALRREDSIFVTYGQLRLVAQVFVPLFLYLLGIAFLGIYLSSALFMALFMLTLGSFRWWQTALAAVLVPLVIFWVFEQQFRVPLPKGPIEAFLGY